MKAGLPSLNFTGPDLSMEKNGGGAKRHRF